MPNTESFIKNLQHRPYEERLKILRTSVVVIGILVVIFWFGLMKLNSFLTTEDDGNSFWAKIKENFAATKEQISNFSTVRPTTTQNLISFPQPLVVTDHKIDQSNNYVINFSIKNSGTDILNFLNLERNNFYLLDGPKKILPIKITTKNEDPFPIKILSNQTLEGMAYFNRPSNQQITLFISGMFFENDAQNIFNQSQELDLGIQIKGAIIRLPRQ